MKGLLKRTSSEVDHQKLSASEEKELLNPRHQKPVH